VKKEAAFVISRVTSAVQGSAPPMENFGVLQSEKAEGSCTEATHSVPSSVQGKSNVTGDPVQNTDLVSS